MCWVSGTLYYVLYFFSSPVSYAREEENGAYTEHEEALKTNKQAQNPTHLHSLPLGESNWVGRGGDQTYLFWQKQTNPPSLTFHVKKPYDEKQ